MKRGETTRTKRSYEKTGFHTLVGALKTRGLAGVDRRSALARGLAADRGELEAHVGGEPSATERRNIDGIQHLDLLIAAGAAHVAKVGPVDRKRHAFRPLARELAGLLESRRRLCVDLGWQARQKPVSSLEELLARAQQDELEAEQAAAAALDAQAVAVEPEGEQPEPERQDGEQRDEGDEPEPADA